MQIRLVIGSNQNQKTEEANDEHEFYSWTIKSTTERIVLAKWNFDKTLKRKTDRHPYINECLVDVFIIKAAQLVCQAGHSDKFPTVDKLHKRKELKLTLPLCC